ncbi:MAG: hypothetical protein F6J96_04900 [Symploca sp. SIO1C2]|nr:hypothetical protein [Symploca sp. SIO1C2]
MYQTQIDRAIATEEAIEAAKVISRKKCTYRRVCIPFGMLRLERSVTHQILGTII